MVGAFFGTTGTVFNKMTPAILRGVAGAIGAGAAEAVMTEGIATGCAKANCVINPDLDYSTELNKHRESVRSIMPLHNWYNGPKPQ